MNYYLVLILFGIIRRTQPYDCVTPDNKDGNCVNVFDCTSMLRRIDQLPRVTDDLIMEFSAHRCDLCGDNSPKVCCPSDHVDVHLPLPTSATAIISTESTDRGANHSLPLITESSKYTDENSINDASYSLDLPANNPFINHSNFYLLPKKCGVLENNNKITHGSETKPFQYPWMALLFERDNVENKIKPTCGGTIINEKYILTAAHCVPKPLEFVRLGEHNLLTPKDCPDAVKSLSNEACPEVQNIEVESIVKHRMFDSNGFGDNDIALIRLKSNINLNALNARPICLPLDQPDLPKKGIISGWGTTSQQSPSSVLMAAEVNIKDFTECRQSYQKYEYKFSDTQICASGDLQDTCNGDSGGPLQYIGFVDFSAAFVQYGVTSFGPPERCGSGIPGIYTRVYDYIPWILDNIKN